MKTNVKSKKWYATGNDLQEGWGDYLKWIDTLKDKVQGGQRISLNQFCWTLYGDGHTSHCWKAFKEHAIALKWKQRRVSHKSWNKTFKIWIAFKYDSHKP